MSRKLRIIGGTLRSRVIQYADVDSIRPTPDRVRETLFNWLQGNLHNARCLEPFAGSGILSIEALSRGAGHCIAIDESETAINTIKANCKLLAIEKSRINCETADARRWIELYQNEPFDIIFLDPPFADKNILALLKACVAILKEDGVIYFESATALNEAETPSGVSLRRQKKAGAVHYALLQRERQTDQKSRE